MCLAFALAAVGVGISCSATSSAAAATRPNTIVIQTDDQDAPSLNHRVMPRTVRYIQRPGTTFTDYIDSGPLCCPSRAVMLTGQYGHNNGVLWDNPNPYGDLRGKGNTLPVWLQRAGYRTVHIGKYLNNYATATGDPNAVAPGWDEWHTVLEPIDYYHYTLRNNGRSAVHYGGSRSDYLTSVLNDEAVRMVHRYVPRRQPLFMALDQYAPHNSVPHRGHCENAPSPAPRDYDLFRHAVVPRPPSWDEMNVSDKPPFVSERHRWGAAGDQIITARHRCRLESLREVDRGVGAIVNALRSEHELANTVIIFTSDNGYIEGLHRIIGGKVNPYEEVLHVPFAIRLPRSLRPSVGVPHRLSSTVANVDVAPTIAKLGRAAPCSAPGHCRVMDGRSMLGTIRTGGRLWPHHRAILLELKTERADPYTPCDYQGIRTSDQVYVEYHGWTGTQRGACIHQEEVEHYDLQTDPFELQNLFPAPPGSEEATVEQELAARLATLKDCAGIKGRDPEPASGHYCE